MLHSARIWQKPLWMPAFRRKSSNWPTRRRILAHWPIDLVMYNSTLYCTLIAVKLSSVPHCLQTEIHLLYKCQLSDALVHVMTYWYIHPQAKVIHSAAPKHGQLLYRLPAFCSGPIYFARSTPLVLRSFLLSIFWVVDYQVRSEIKSTRSCYQKVLLELWLWLSFNSDINLKNSYFN